MDDILYEKLKDLILRKVMLKIFGKIVGGWRLKLLEITIGYAFKNFIAPAMRYLQGKAILVVHTVNLKKQLKRLDNAKTSADFDSAFDKLL